MRLVCRCLCVKTTGVNSGRIASNETRPLNLSFSRVMSGAAIHFGGTNLALFPFRDPCNARCPASWHVVRLCKVISHFTHFRSRNWSWMKLNEADTSSTDVQILCSKLWPWYNYIYIYNIDIIIYDIPLIELFPVLSLFFSERLRWRPSWRPSSWSRGTPICGAPHASWWPNRAASPPSPWPSAWPKSWARRRAMFSAEQI